MEAVKDTTGRQVLVATISASGMAFMMQSALNLALPAIQRELGATGADVLWIVNVYQLLLGALILVGGSLGDHYGRKRVYMIGIGVFTTGSLLCGLAPSTETLILFRAVQGIGGALMVPGSLAIIAAYFDDDVRGQAIGTWSALTTMLSVLAPVVGGFLAENDLWRGVFFITIPFAAIALWTLARYVPESRDENASARLDYTGAALITVGMGGIVFGATEIGRAGLDGFTNPLLVGTLLMGLFALIAFVWFERRTSNPMVNMRLFRSRTFSGANLLTLLLYGALGGVLVFLPLNLIQVQGYGETVAGFAQLPFSILLIVMSPWAGGLVEKVGPRLPLTVGPLIVALGFVMLALPGMTGGPADYWTTYFPGIFLFGFGMGVVVAPLTTTVMGSVPRHNSGVASGVNNAISRSAGSLTTAVLGGVALIVFVNMLTANVEALNLSDAANDQLVENAQDLAETQVPEAISGDAAEEVASAIDESFVQTFRLLMLVGAAMSVVSALLAAVFIEKRLPHPEG